MPDPYLDEMTRPIVGIENRTAQEVFDMMCARFRHRASEAERVREAAAAMLEQAVGEGYPTPKNKVDTCEHGKYGWEDCIACYDERLLEVAAAIRSLPIGGE